jgi:hypothetical protein
MKYFDSSNFLEVHTLKNRGYTFLKIWSDLAKLHRYDMCVLKKEFGGRIP